MNQPDRKQEQSTGAHSSTGLAGDFASEPAESDRKRVADGLPFILRAWWLREFQEYKDLVWRDEQYVTGPVWSLYSDPGCDMAGLDYAYDFEED